MCALALWETAVALRLPVFPCLPDKKPAKPKAHGGNGFKDATTDPQQIRELFRAYPQATLIGVPTGEISGFDVLDIDNTRHPEAGVWARSAPIPRTRAQQTASGGRHYLFRHHRGLSSWTAYPVVGVDGRGDGGYVIAWGAAGYPSNGASLLPWPDDLLALVRRSTSPRQATPDLKPEQIEASLRGLYRHVARATNGQRNNCLFWAACRVGEMISAGKVGQSDGERFLLTAALQTGLDHPSAAATIASGFRTTGKSA